MAQVDFSLIEQQSGLQQKLDRLARMPGDEKTAWLLLAVAIGPIPITIYKQILRSKKATLLSPGVKSLDAESLLEYWDSAGMATIIENEWSGTVFCSVSEDIRETAVRQTLKEGTFEQYCQAAETHLRIPNVKDSLWNRNFSDDWKAVYCLRKYFYLGDLESYVALFPFSCKDRTTQKSCLFTFATKILDNPCDWDLISRFPAGGRWRLLDALAMIPSHLEDRIDLLDAMTDLCRKYPFKDAIGALVRHLCNAGRFDVAAEFFPKMNPTDRMYFSAVDALVRGKQQEAKKYFEKFIAERYAAKAPTSIEDQLWEPFYPVLLFALHEPAEKIFKAIERMNKNTAWYDGNLVWHIMNLLVANCDLPSIAAKFAADSHVKSIGDSIEKMFPVLADDDVERYKQLVQALNNYSVLSFMHILFFAVWFAPETATKWLSALSACASALDLKGYSFFASELEACAAMLRGEEDDEAHPIRDLIKKQPQWLSALERLESFAAEAQQKTKRKRSERRVIWLAGKDDENRYGYTVKAVEQSLSASGKWSKGREIAVSTLAKGLSRITGLSEQERLVANAVHMYNEFGSVYYELDPYHALSFLAGCRNIYRADDRTPLDVIKSEPQIEVSEVPGGSLLRLLPENPEQYYRLVVEENHSQLRVIEFNDTQLSLASIIGKGVTIPNSQKERIATLLGNLAPTITVQSQIAAQERNIPTIDADPRLRVQLSPSGDGLNAEFVVRPFGDGGISCAPGKGGEMLLGVKKGTDGKEQRVQAHRDLNAEEALFVNAVAACPALNGGDRIHTSRWQLADIENCLEFLLQLKNVPDLITEWPRGGSMSVRRELGGSTMLGAIQSSGTDWFALTGTVRVDEELTLSLRQMMNRLHQAKSRFIPVGEGQYVALTHEFRRRLEQLDALSDGTGEKIKISAPAASAVAQLFDEGALAGDSKWEETCTRFKEAQTLAVEVPRTLRAELRPYQLDGFRWLARLAHWGAGACLADDMGLGKTVQALAMLLRRAEGGPALVVAPTSVCGNWIDEAYRFAPTLNFIDFRGGKKLPESLEPLDVVLVSYGMLQSRSAQFKGRQWHTIILDEAQAIKNMTTKRSDAIMALHGDFRMAMTGTPVENRLSELWNLFRFLNPGLLGSLASFNRRFTPQEDDQAPLHRLRKIISPFLLRRVKEDVLDDLPGRTEITLRIDLTPEERAFYEALRQNAVEAVAATDDAPDQQKRFTIFAQLMKLRRACCSASLAEAGLGANIPSSKLAALLEKVGELKENGHRALIFSQFTDHLSLIRTALEEKGVECLYLDGSTPAAARRALVRDFQSGKGDCFLISLRAGGTGLNLTGADFVIHMDPWWNPAVEDQASDRAYRIGQTRPVTVYRLVARGTVEEKIVDLHRVKRELAENILDGAASPAALDIEALAALLREE